MTNCYSGRDDDEAGSLARKAWKAVRGITDDDAVLFFGGVREGEDREAFKERVFRHLDHRGVFGEDGKLSPELLERSEKRSG